MFFSSSTLLQYHYLMSRFMYRFLVVKRGPVCLMGQHCVAFKKENSPIHLRGLAAPVIWKVRVLWYEFTDVTLAWEDGQWVEAHKIILAGCSPKKAPQPSCLSWMVLILMSRKQKRKRQTGPPSGCPKLVLWLRQLKRGACLWSKWVGDPDYIRTGCSIIVKNRYRSSIISHWCFLQ